MRLAGQKVKIELEALLQIIRVIEVQGQVQIAVVGLITTGLVIAIRMHVQEVITIPDTTDLALIKGHHRPTGLIPQVEEAVLQG